MTQELSAEQKLTPMMEQYRSIKKTLPKETILFFRLGDFYEMFFEDAVRASEILNITLTGREGGAAGRIPMCGIPYHAFQQYVRTLLDKNLKVAICEQIGDPQAAKGLVERKITRIISPATYLDEESKTPQAEYMVAVASNRSEWAVAALDLGTGDFLVREVPRDRLIHELTLLNPREAILPKALQQDEELANFFKQGVQAAVMVYDNWVFDPGEASRLIKENFKLTSERNIPFYDRPVAIAAAGAILYYLKDHLHSALGHIRMPALLQADDFMTLDRQTLKNLELVSHAGGGTRTGSLISCIDQTLTSMGARTLYHWVTHPLLSLPEIVRRQEAVAELVQESSVTQNLRFVFKGTRDVERTMSRLNYGVANARDLLQLAVFLEKLPELQALLGGSKSGLLKELNRAIREFPELHGLILKAVVESPPVGLKEGGIIRDGYSKELDELRRFSSEGKNWLLEFEQREVERTGIRSLKIRYSQVFGYAIEVSKPNLHLVPKDYVRRQTLANAERFITPELKRWDEQIAGAQEKIKGLEYQLFQEIRQKALESLVPLQETARSAGTLDALASLAITAIQKRWVRPEVSSSKELTIRGGRHPVVEAMLPAGQFVENDAELDGAGNQLIILTGPNMAGKSTYIRQIAQIVLLAQIGSFVPAQSAVIGLVDRVFTRIGASDDLARGESTFMVEMIEMAHILRSATDRSLLILDEVGRGTSTFDGVSLAWAICEHLMQGMIRPRTLFATHYHELTQLESEFQNGKNYTITVKETPEGIVFLRKVARGGADRSYGIHVARLAGIPEEVTARADRILQVLENESSQAARIMTAEGPHSGQRKWSGAPHTRTMTAEGEDSFPVRDKQELVHPVIEEILGVPVETLTPLEALNKLAQWNRRLKDEKGEV